MYRPGGYGKITGDRGVTAFDSNARSIPTECDTFTCNHCCKVVFVRPGERGADLGGFCKCCTGLICIACVDDGRCSPLEQRLEAMARRQDTLRSYGMT